MMNEPVPSSWEDLANSRERLARIETKVDMILSTLVVQDQKILTLDTRLNALEAGRMANRADIERALAELVLLNKERDALDMSPARFQERMRRWDKASDVVEQNNVVSIARQAMRKQDWAILGGIATAAGTISGVAFKFIGG